MWDDVVTCYQLLEKPHRAEVSSICCIYLCLFTWISSFSVFIVCFFELLDVFK